MQVSSDADHPEHHKSEGQQQAVHSKKGQHDVDRQGNRPTHEEHIAQDRSDGCPEGFQRCRSTPGHHTEQELLCQPPDLGASTSSVINKKPLPAWEGPGEG